MRSEETFAQYLATLAEQDLFSGTILIAQGDQPLFQQAYGWADREQKVPNRLTTAFNLASVGKMFTSIALAQLVESGQASFSSPIDLYLPGFRHEGANTITLHHLLTHTSGMHDFMRNEHYFALREQMHNASEFLPLIQQEPLQFSPGQQYLYSNSGYAVLGAIIEQVSGQNYYEYIQQHIFQVAGMTHSDFYTEQAQLTELARPYTNNEAALAMMRDPSWQPKTWHPRKGSPAGGCYSTLEDLLHFSRALQGHALLSPAMLELITRGKVQVGENFSYAYGFCESFRNGLRWIGHMGGSPGVATQLDFCLEQQGTIIILCNQDHSPAFLDVCEQAKQCWDQQYHNNQD